MTVLRFSALSLFAIAALAAAAYYFYLPGIVKHEAEAAIRSTGFPSATVGDIVLTPGQAKLGGIVLDADGFSTIREISVSFDWPDLILHGRLEALNLSGVELSALMDPGGSFSLSGWTPSQTSGTGESALPVRSLSWEGVRLDIDTPWGALRFESRGRMMESNQGLPVFQGEITGAQQQASVDIGLSGTLDSSGAWALDADIRDARLDLDKTLGASRIGGRIKLFGGPGQPVRAEGQITAGTAHIGSMPLQSVTAALSGSLPDITVTAEAQAGGAPDIRISGEGGLKDGALLAAGRLTVEKPGALASFAEGLTGAKGSSSDLLGALPPFIADLKYKKQGSEKEGLYPFEIHVQETGGPLTLTATLTYDRTAEKVDGTLTLPATPAAALMPFPGMEKQTGPRATGGTVSADGEIHWLLSSDPVAIKGPLTVQLASVDLEQDGQTINGVNGKFRLDTLYPPSMPPQTLIFSEAAAGLPLTGGRVTFGLKPDGTVQVTQASALYADGTLTVQPFDMSSGKAPRNLTVKIEGLDLARLAGETSESELRLRGLLDGTIELAFEKDGHILVKSGALKNREPGSVSYNPASPPPFLQGSGPSMETVRQALQNFDFELLNVTIAGPVDGDMTARVEATGHNRPLFGDRPINLNLTLEGPLPAVLSSASGQ